MASSMHCTSLTETETAMINDCPTSLPKHKKILHSRGKEKSMGAISMQVKRGEKIADLAPAQMQMAPEDETSSSRAPTKMLSLTAKQESALGDNLDEQSCDEVTTTFEMLQQASSELKLQQYTLTSQDSYKPSATDERKWQQNVGGNLKRTRACIDLASSHEDSEPYFASFEHYSGLKNERNFVKSFVNSALLSEAKTQNQSPFAQQSANNHAKATHPFSQSQHNPHGLASFKKHSSSFVSSEKKPGEENKMQGV